MKTRRFGTVTAFLCILNLLTLVRGPAFADRLQPQVQVEAKLVEVSQDSKRQLGVSFAQALGKVPSVTSNLTSPALATFGLGPNPSASIIDARFFPSNGTPGALNLSGVLTGPEFQNILDTLGHGKGSKVLSAPTLITPSDQKANIHINSPIPTFHSGGVAIEFTPRIGADGTSIEMTITPQVGSGTAMPQLPVGATSMVTFGSGETAVLGGIISETSGRQENLILFITPQRVDVLSHSTAGKGPDQIKVEAIGTGETIGHVADLKIQNLTDQALDMIVPALILESSNARNQDYVCPEEKSVTIASRQTETVPVNGVCINRDKPPVGKGVTGALVMNTVDPGIAQHSDCHIPAKQAGDLLRICRSTYDAVDQLQKDGAFKDFPYKDKQEQKDILVEWCTWADPRVCEISKAPPATKDDLKKVVYKQLEEKGKTNSETTKKIDKGIDTIFEKIELTSTKAKDLEEPAQSADLPPGANNVSDNTPTPPPAPLWAPKFPGTEEKAKPDWPPPVQKWIDKKRIADSANKNKEAAHKDYAGVLRKFFQKSRHYNDLKNQRTAAAEDFAENGNKEDKAKLDAADKELKKLEGELEKDFLKTPEGQAEFKKMTDVDKAADQANAEEKEAGKNLDKATKDAVQKAEAEKHPEKKAAADDD